MNQKPITPEIRAALLLVLNHQYTSCSDDQPRNIVTGPHSASPRCARCFLLSTGEYDDHLPGYVVSISATINHTPTKSKLDKLQEIENEARRLRRELGISE